MSFAHPILTCAEARAWEARVLGDDPKRVWTAMQCAGVGVGAAILRDFTQWRPMPRNPRVLVLAGPGHNGGDALLAVHEILKARPRGAATVVLLEPLKKLKPLTKRAWKELSAHAGVKAIAPGKFLTLLESGEKWDITVDGLYGMGFRPPLPEPAQRLIEKINQSEFSPGFRAAVDIPSGLGDKSAETTFNADFIYATGIAKSPLFEAKNSELGGRIRYVDIGFFENDYTGSRAHPEDLLLAEILDPIRQLRFSAVDKIRYGHSLIISGSRAYPGAQMLNVLGALRAGAGLVTALTPASHAAAFAAARPEAMWRACAEEADGGHGAATLAAARELWPRCRAVVAGSGLGRGQHTQAMLQELVAECPLPLVLDADALMPPILQAIAKRPKSAGAVILTPHAGEFERIAGKNADVAEFCRKHRVITVLKGPITRISDGKKIWCSTFGGPVLARGGSGDILAGMIGALYAQPPHDAMLSAARAVVWHGLAADALARTRGETAALTVELANYLPEALRNEWGG